MRKTSFRGKAHRLTPSSAHSPTSTEVKPMDETSEGEGVSYRGPPSLRISYPYLLVKAAEKRQRP